MDEMDPHYAGMLDTKISFTGTTQQLNVISNVGIAAAKKDTQKMERETQRQIKLEILAAMRTIVGETPTLKDALEVLKQVAPKHPGVSITDPEGEEIIDDIKTNLCLEAA